MKINGQSPSIAQGECVIPRGDKPLTILVSALPLTWTELTLRVLPAPVPPQEYAKTPGTNKLLKDASGRPYLIRNADDAEFILAHQLHAEYLTVWTVYEALRLDRGVVFDTQKPEKLTVSTSKSFLEAVRREMDEAGFTSGDLSLIIQKLSELSNLDSKKVEESRLSFLSMDLQAEIGKSPRDPEEPSVI